MFGSGNMTYIPNVLDPLNERKDFFVSFISKSSNARENFSLKKFQRRTTPCGDMSHLRCNAGFLHCTCAIATPDDCYGSTRRQ
jgi:hypothetical protein